MKRSLVVMALMAFLISACMLPVRHTEVRGSGNLLTEIRKVSGFERVALSGIGKLVILQGDEEGLEINAEDNILPRIEIKVFAGTLTIGFEEFINIIPTKPITYTLKVKNLSGIETSGIGEINASSLISNNLEIDISGAGNVELTNLVAENLKVRISGTGNFDLAGKVIDQTIELSGLGNYQAKDLESETAWVKISGAGNATVWVIKTLIAEISGVGNLSYYGSPQITQEVSGLGKVYARGER